MPSFRNIPPPRTVSGRFAMQLSVFRWPAVAQLVYCTAFSAWHIGTLQSRARTKSNTLVIARFYRVALIQFIAEQWSPRVTGSAEGTHWPVLHSRRNASSCTNHGHVTITCTLSRRLRRRVDVIISHELITSTNFSNWSTVAYAA